MTTDIAPEPATAATAPEEPDLGWGHFGHCPHADGGGEFEECICDQLEWEIVR